MANLKVQSRKHGEDDLQVAVVAFLKIALPRTYSVFHIPNGGHRSPRAAARFKKMGVLAGVWDLQFLGPAFKPTAFVELKWGKNDLSDSQKEFRDRFLIPLKVPHCVAWSLDEVVAFLKSHKVPLRVQL
jgi:hypothetical protein